MASEKASFKIFAIFTFQMKQVSFKIWSALLFFYSGIYGGKNTREKRERRHFGQGAI